MLSARNHQLPLDLDAFRAAGHARGRVIFPNTFPARRPLITIARCATLLLAIALITACSADRTALTEPTEEGRPAFAGGITPMCQLGCIDPDPEPDADGYSLGSGVTWQACTNGTQGDSDQDGLSDYCETNLAQAFAPELFYTSYDETGREPKWIAKLEQGQVRIMYLLSYYRDAGSAAFGCSLPGAPDSCFGHNGDSEAIGIDVVFNGSTQHWVLESAWLSQHGTMREYSGTGCTYTGDGGAWCVVLTYPDAYRGYPRVWVSQGKHANYGDGPDCENGGIGDVDTCYDHDTYARVVAGKFTNLGSRAHHSASQDCMPSSDPSYIYYGSGRTECYWSYRNFRGWIPTTVGGMESRPPYTSIVSQLGF